MRLSDIFGTFKNERVGLYVILAVMLVSVGAMMLLHRCQDCETASEQSVETRVERAEALVDSLEQLRADTLKLKARRSKKQAAKRDSAKQKTVIPDRTLDEVPQF